MMKWLLRTEAIMSLMTQGATTHLLPVVAIGLAEPMERWDHFVSPGSVTSIGGRGPSFFQASFMTKENKLEFDARGCDEVPHSGVCDKLD
jgi:hypothetical protein